MTKLLAMPGEGERLDRFELVAEIAQGGMATVYLARLVGVGGFKRFVAIKRLHAHLAQEQEFIEMFLDEARIAARIHHPNVVPILEIGENSGMYYLVMEYIEGDTAGRLVARAAGRQQRLPPAITARIMLDSLTGLHAAHELRDDNGQLQHVVHRDVSPQNILVGVDGVARITDFGVARAAARLTSTRGGQVKGKLAYLSPEQVRGIEVDRRADVFAAGIVMWELFTSERLFKGEADADTLFRIVAAEVPSMRAIHPQVPPAVEAVCLKALARDPKDRWQTAQDFAEALENAGRANGCLANIRETSTYVNEILGQDISAQRDIVRAWLARSESRSGVAPSLAGSVPRPADASGAQRQMKGTQPMQQVPQAAPAPQWQTPRPNAPMAAPPTAPRPPQMSVPTAREMQPPAMAPPPPQLTSLEDDDEDVATRVDQPLAEREAKSMPPMPLPNLQGHPESQPYQQPHQQPQIHMAQPGVRPGSELNATIPVIENQQPGAPSPFANAQALPAPVPMAPQQPRQQSSGLPAWTLAIPAALIAIAAVVLALKFLKQPADDAGKPHPTATVSAAASTAPVTPTVTIPTVDTSTVAPTPTTVDTSTAAPPSTTTAPTGNTTAVATTPPATATTPTPTPVTTATPTPVNTGSRPTPINTGGPKPLGTGTKPKKPVLDNPDFGGRR